jgi:hypothetical protein
MSSSNVIWSGRMLRTLHISAMAESNFCGQILPIFALAQIETQFSQSLA